MRLSRPFPCSEPGRCHLCSPCHGQGKETDQQAQLFGDRETGVFQVETPGLCFGKQTFDGPTFAVGGQGVMGGLVADQGNRIWISPATLRLKKTSRPDHKRNERAKKFMLCSSAKGLDFQMRLPWVADNDKQFLTLDAPGCEVQPERRSAPGSLEVGRECARATAGAQQGSQALPDAVPACHVPVRLHADDERNVLFMQETEPPPTKGHLDF